MFWIYLGSIFLLILCSPYKNLDKKLNNFLDKCFMVSKPEPFTESTSITTIMSRRVSPQSKMSASSEQTFFCKVCKDAGKSKSEFTSHNVKAPNGRTCCPTLLSTCCKNCHNMGHTAAYCKTVSFMTKEVNKAARAVNRKIVPDSKASATTVSNLFSGLEIDGSSDEEESTPRSPKKVINASIDAPGAPVKAPVVRLSLAQRIKLDWADDSEEEEE